MVKKKFFSFILNVFAIIFFVCFIGLILCPAPLKPIIRTFIKSTNYPVNSDAQKFDNYVLYKSPKELSSKRDTESQQPTTTSAASATSTDDAPQADEATTDQSTTTSTTANNTQSNSSNTNELKIQLNKLNVDLNHKNIISKTSFESSTPQSKTKLIVVFIGGSFLFRDLTSHYGIGNELYKLFQNDGYDIMLMSYPVRFSHTLQQSMLSINDTLQKFLRKYDSFYAIGYSAGALLATVFMQKEADLSYSQQIQIPQIGISFKKFVGICGLYYPQFNNNLILTKLFYYYILRKTTNGKMYSSSNPLEKIPKLVISSTTDFLYNQTTKFIQNTPNTTYKIFNNPSLTHTFVENINLLETVESLNLIHKFIIA